jgi:hypothetical protein
MRKRYRVLILAAIVAAVVGRVGFALSLQSGSFQAPGVPSSAASRASSAAAGTVIVASTSKAAPALLAGSRYMPVSHLPQLPRVPDGAMLLGLGTVLLGLAAAVRRAV